MKFPQYNYVKITSDPCRELRKQRDVLLEACRDAERWLSGWTSSEPYLTRIRSAIDYAEKRIDA